MSGPLAGIRVVDLSQIVSGPMAACVLADQGADVIKVESPGGDPVRWLGPRKGDLSAMFITVNRGKRAITLDLKRSEARAVLDRLVGWADVLIENFRPGALDRLGFNAARCMAVNPRLIYASINGFGRDGPYANIRVYDPVIQAVSGTAALQAGRGGTPELMRTLIADKTTALTAAQAITAALFARERSGTGQRIEVAMLDAAIAFNWADGMWNDTFLDAAPPAWPPYGAQMRLWAAADGQVALGALQDSEFQALCRVIDRPGLAADPRLATVAGRNAHRSEWAPALAEAIKAIDVDTLMDRFIAHGAVGGRVNRIDEVAADPQVIHNGSVAVIDHGAAGRVATPRPAPLFDGGSGDALRPAPGLGEHSAAVLRDLGYAGPEIAAMIAGGIAHGPSTTP